MSIYAQHVSTKSTPQTRPIPGKKQIPNSAGGFVFQLDPWKQLDRFLILGCAGGSYYAGEREMTVENAGVVTACAQLDPARTVSRIVAVSDGGLAPKNDPAVFALALCTTVSGAAPAAYAAVPRVCRIGTHLFQFAAACNAVRGWGRGLRRAVANWYTSRTDGDLAYQAVKYQQRNGWSHRDLLRLAHPKKNTPVLRWMTGADVAARDVLRRTSAGGVGRGYDATGELPALIRAFDSLKGCTDPKIAAAVIRTYNLPRECVPTELLKDAGVWDALLERMPLHAMVRNLGNMTKVGLLAPLSDAARRVQAALGDGEKIAKARLHPLSILTALRTYSAGHGLKGGGTWVPVQSVVDALDGAYYAAFDAVVPTGKRWLFGLDVSGSMGTPCAGTPLTCAEGAAALAMTAVRTEPYTFTGGFCNVFTPLQFGARSRLNEVLAETRKHNFGTTDCSQPMEYALTRKIQVDVFVVITDNETYAGARHPVQALQAYRNATGIAAKLIVIGMTATGFTIADPSDEGMLDVCGFSTDVPAVMSEFVRG